MQSKQLGGVTIIDLQEPPKQIPLDELHDDYRDGKLRLLSKEDVDFWKNVMSNNKIINGRYNKTELEKFGDAYARSNNLTYREPKFGIVKHNNSLSVVYYGLMKEDKLKTKKIIGKGRFGVVKLSQNIDTGEISVLKVMHEKVKLFRSKKDLERDQKKMEQYQKKEIENLKIMGLLNFNYDHTSKKGPEVLVGMKLVQGREAYAELAEMFETNNGLIKNPEFNNNLSSIQYLNIVKNIIAATKEVHDKNIIHRDIKPENYIINGERAKLIDFGLSAHVEHGPIEVKDAVFCGTPLYCPPEVILNREKTYNKGTDAYNMLMVIADALDLSEEADPIKKKDRTYYQMKIVTEENPKFKNNKRLPDDPALRKEILQFLQIATQSPSKKHPNRVTPEEVMSFFESVYKRLGKEEIEKFRVATISIETFLENPKAVIDGLNTKEIKAIVLIDNIRGRSQKEYIDAKRKLEELGIKNISPKVFFGDDNIALNQSVQNYYNNIFGVNPPIYNFSLDAKELKEQKVVIPQVSQTQAAKVVAPPSTSSTAWMGKTAPSVRTANITMGEKRSSKEEASEPKPSETKPTPSKWAGARPNYGLFKDKVSQAKATEKKSSPSDIETATPRGSKGK